MAAISFRDVHGIAEELGVDVQTVRRWIQSGKLRAFKPGKEYRIRDADLEEFLAAREVRPKAVTSPSQRSLFNGEERRAFIERCERYVAGKVAHYEELLAEAKSGGLFAGFKGAQRLQDYAFEDFSQFCDLTNGELQERWVEDPRVSEAAKEELGRDLTDAQRPFLEVVGRIGDLAAELAETPAQLEEVKQRDEQLRERKRDISKSA